MKVSKYTIVAGQAGSVEMRPIDSDDLWYVYNLIAPGDTVRATTVRKVVRDLTSSRGGTSAERVQLKLEIRVQVVADYDNVGSVLLVRGKNISPNGAYHTLELELERPFVLTKDIWDSLALEELKEASDPAGSADLAVVLMQEVLAQIYLVGRSVTVTRARMETSIPRKHGPSVKGYESASNRFFKKVLQGFLQHVNFSVVGCVVIASPGFTKDQFHKHLLLEAERRKLRPIMENKLQIVLVHSNSGCKHSLREVLDDEKITSMIKDTKAAEEVRALKDFFDMMSTDADRACYGLKHVEVAHEKLAVQTLLITDELIRNADVVVRQKYVDLENSVQDFRHC